MSDSTRPQDNRFKYSGRVRDGQIASEFLQVEMGQNFIGIYYKPPDKPREGMIAIADGNKWNPGKGAGVYFYHLNKWRSLEEYGYEN